MKLYFYEMSSSTGSMVWLCFSEVNFKKMSFGSRFKWIM